MKHFINQAVVDQIQTPTNKEPFACFLLGANGSGKSTLRHYLNLENIPVNIDPEVLTRLLNIKNKHIIQINAAKQAQQLFQYALNRSLSVCLESTLAGKGTQKRISQVQQQGYYVVGYFLGTNNVEINLQRIKNRVAQGGHDIPEYLVRKRFSESYQIMLEKLSYFNEAHFIDNTKEYYDLQLSIINGKKIQQSECLQSWVKPFQ